MCHNEIENEYDPLSACRCSSSISKIVRCIDEEENIQLSIDCYNSTKNIFDQLRTIIHRIYFDSSETDLPMRRHLSRSVVHENNESDAIEL